MKTIAILGGGAAGMMCAAVILERMSEIPDGTKFHIHLFEKNAVLGKKVSISGGGRCNITTGITDKKLLLGKYTRGAEFLRNALGKFGPKKVMEWFELHGVRVKCEKDLRIFPVSDNSTEVIGAFEKVFLHHKNQITVHTSTTVKALEQTSNTYLIQYDTGKIDADIVVITTGGNAYAHTGSSGDGYSFSKKLGHSITDLGPSLSSFELAEAFPKTLSGISLAKAQLRWSSEILTEGPILFTHFGISGPGPFAFSSLIAFEKIDKGNPLQISLAPMAGWGVQEWDRHIEREAKTHSNREVKNILDMLPRRLVDAMGTSGIVPVRILNQKGATLSKEDRKSLSKVLGEGIPLTIIARRAGDEFVTAGGVDCAEVDAESLESKIKTGLFFAGEVLNIDGVTGGFNLQAAWSTGNLAGRSIVDRLKILK